MCVLTLGWLLQSGMKLPRENAFYSSENPYGLTSFDREYFSHHRTHDLSAEVNLITTEINLIRVTVH